MGTPSITTGRREGAGLEGDGALGVGSGQVCGIWGHPSGAGGWT